MRPKPISTWKAETPQVRRSSSRSVYNWRLQILDDPQAVHLMFVARRNRLDIVPLNGEARGCCFVEDIQDGLERFQQSPLEIGGNFGVRSGCNELNDGL